MNSCKFSDSRVFRIKYRVAKNWNIGIRGFYSGKKNQLPPVGLDLMITGSRVMLAWHWLLICFNACVSMHFRYKIDQLQICLSKCIFTARKRSLRRLCFHRCLSAHRRGVCHTHPWTDTPRQTPPQAYTPLGRHTPLPSACWNTHPHAQCMLGYSQQAGGYASHWNAFLLNRIFHILI